MIYKVVFQKPPLERQIIDCDVTFPFNRRVITCDVLDLGDAHFILCDVHDLTSRQSISVRNVIELTNLSVDTIAEMSADLLCDSILICSPSIPAVLGKNTSVKSKLLLQYADMPTKISQTVGFDGNIILISNQDISPQLNSKTGRIQECISIFSGGINTETTRALHPSSNTMQLGCSDIRTSISQHARPTRNVIDMNVKAHIHGHIESKLDPIDLCINQSSFKLSYSLFADSLDPIVIHTNPGELNIGMNWAVRVQNELQLQSNITPSNLRISEQVSSALTMDSSVKIHEQWAGVSLDELRIEIQENTINTELYRLRKLLEMDEIALADFDDMILHQTDYIKVELEP